MIINKKYFYSLIVVIIIIGCSIALSLYFNSNGYKLKSIDKELEDIYELPSSYTILEAENNNIVNVSNTLEKESKLINKFLLDIDNKKCPF